MITQMRLTAIYFFVIQKYTLVSQKKKIIWYSSSQDSLFDSFMFKRKILCMRPGQSFLCLAIIWFFSWCFTICVCGVLLACTAQTPITIQYLAVYGVANNSYSAFTLGNLCKVLGRNIVVSWIISCSANVISQAYCFLNVCNKAFYVEPNVNPDKEIVFYVEKCLTVM